MYIYTYTYVYIHIYIYVHICTHIYIYTEVSSAIESLFISASHFFVELQCVYLPLAIPTTGTRATQFPLPHFPSAHGKNWQGASPPPPPLPPVMEVNLRHAKTL